MLPAPESGDFVEVRSRIHINRSVICNCLVWVSYLVKEIHLVYTVYYPIPVAALSKA
jgi:hypothetical protein